MPLRFWRILGSAVISLVVLASGLARGQSATKRLDEVRVFSDRVANQAPAGTFSMPISILRYEPRVDIQARNLGEAQADITIRGGTFESIGIRVGGSSLLDPQTGHYLAEIPIALEMLTPPEVVTGSGFALGATNATSGGLVFGWREIERRGALRVSAGQGKFASGELYQGFVRGSGSGNSVVRGDFSVARSTSDGLVRFGDHEFGRVNGRLQLRGLRSQTDLFAGYQAKTFGWPNLYTPFNSPETENLQTVLLALNHRIESDRYRFLEASVYHRRNKDDYAFDRFAPLGPVHPFQHTTWISGAAVSGRYGDAHLAGIFRMEFLADKIESTSLTFGRYNTRSLGKISAAAERAWAARDGRVVVTGGLALDDSNRAGSAVSPSVELAREWPGSALTRIHLGFSGSTQLPGYTALNSNPSAGLFRGNANLGRGKAQNLEIGVTGSFFGWSGQAAVFHRADRQLVDWTFRRGVTARSANPVDVETTGLEIVARRSWARVDLVVGYGGLLKDADYRGATVNASFYALNYARHRLTAALVWRIDREWTLHVDHAARVQADNSLRLIGGDEAISGALDLTYRPKSFRGLAISLRAENLWDSDYQEVPAVPASPRQVSLGLAFGW